MSRIEAEEILDEINEVSKELVTMETIDLLLKEIEEIRNGYKEINKHINSVVMELDSIDDEVDKLTIAVNDIALKMKEEL